MSNFVSTLLSICIHFLLVFLKFLLILILNKLVNSYIFPQGKTAMHRLKGSLTLSMGKCLWFSVKIKVCQSSLSSQ